VYTRISDNIYPQFRLALYFLVGNCCVKSGGGGGWGEGVSVYETRYFVGYELQSQFLCFRVVRSTYTSFCTPTSVQLGNDPFLAFEMSVNEFEAGKTQM